MGSPHKVVNPATGRLVLKTGSIGRAVVAVAKKKGVTATSKSKSIVNKNVKKDVKKRRPDCPDVRCAPKKKKGGPVPGRYYGYKGATKKAPPCIKRAGKTKNYASRPSARACFNAGEYGPVCYGGILHVMKFRENGSPYWAKA